MPSKKKNVNKNILSNKNKIHIVIDNRKTVSKRKRNNKFNALTR